MADASLDTWAAVEPQWRAAGPLLDREIRRFGTAAVRGGMAALLNSLHPRIRYHDGSAVPPAATSWSTCYQADPAMIEMSGAVDTGPVGGVTVRLAAV
jgi:hypothetical protein